MNAHFSRSCLELSIVHQQARWCLRFFSWLVRHEKTGPASWEERVDTGLVLSKCRWSFHQHLKTSQKVLTPHSTTPTGISMCPYYYFWWFIFFCTLWRWLWCSPFCSFHPEMLTEPLDVVLGTMSTGISKKPMAPALIVFTLVRTDTSMVERCYFKFDNNCIVQKEWMFTHSSQVFALMCLFSYSLINSFIQLLINLPWLFSSIYAHWLAWLALLWYTN